MKNLQSIVRATVALVLLMLMAGCDPENLLVWSPDGSKATVIGGSGLYVTDPQGAVSSVLIPHAKSSAWIDAKRVVAVFDRPSVNWHDIEQLASDSQKASIIKLADKFYPQAMGFNGTAEQFSNENEAELKDIQTDDLIGVLLLLREQHGKELGQKFGDDWKKLQDTDLAMHVIQVFDLSSGKAEPGPVLGFTFSNVYDLRPSPNGTAIAYTLADSVSPGTARLLLSPADGSHPSTLIADLCARNPDWSADSQYLVYARANLPRGDAGNGLRLGSLRRLRVMDDSGKLLTDLPVNEKQTVVGPDGAKTEKDADVQVLAGVIFSEWTKVRCTHNGDVIFSSAAVALPATTDGMPSEATLFGVTVSAKPAVKRMISADMQSKIGEMVNQFEISPDETRAIIPGRGNRITVINFTNGEVVEVQPANGDIDLRMIPKWRNNDEITFAVTNGEKDQSKRPGDVMIWSKAAGLRKLSEKWSADVVESLRDPGSESAGAAH